jgi:hypothetical protein
MGKTMFKFKNEEDMLKSIPLLIEYFEKNYNKDALTKLGVPKEEQGELCYSWNSKKKEEFAFLIDAKPNWFFPFWVSKKELKMSMFKNGKTRYYLDKSPRLVLNDAYVFESKLLKYLLDNGIEFMDNSYMHGVVGKILGVKCKRCKHSWVLRREQLPKVCPKCKSPYWNKEKTKMK